MRVRESVAEGLLIQQPVDDMLFLLLRKEELLLVSLGARRRAVKPALEG